MASKQELLNSIKPDMRLGKGFFLKVFGYDTTEPGFADIALSKLETAGCSKARAYYTGIVGAWQTEHDAMMKQVAEWYINFDRKKASEPRTIQQEAEQRKALLQKMSDRELLILLQRKKQQRQSQYATTDTLGE